MSLLYPLSTKKLISPVLVVAIALLLAAALSRISRKRRQHDAIFHANKKAKE